MRFTATALLRFSPFAALKLESRDAPVMHGDCWRCQQRQQFHSVRSRQCRRGASAEEGSCFAPVVGVVFGRQALEEVSEQCQIGVVIGRG